MAYIGNSPANTGNYQLVDDIASSFNGTLVSFALTAGGIAITPAKSGQILANINGVMQEPDDTGTNGFKVTGSNIVFSSAPASSDTFWAVYQGQNVDIGTPSDDVVDTAHIKDDAVTAAKLANSINTEIAANTAKTGITSGQASAITANTAKTGITSGQASAITANTAKVTNSTSATDLTSGTLPTARLPAGSVLQVKTFSVSTSQTLTNTTAVALTDWDFTITKVQSNSRILCFAKWYCYYTTAASYWWIKAYANGVEVDSSNSFNTSFATHNATQYTYNVSAHQQFNGQFHDSTNASSVNFTFEADQSTAQTLNFWGSGHHQFIFMEIAV